MLKLKKIAVTGGIASGKSTVCKIFAELGATTVNSDAIVHALLSPKTDLGQQVIALLGSECMSGESFDRQKIADKVFEDRKLLEKLETLIHPKVLEEIERRYQKADSPFVVELPLLFEGNFDPFFDITIVVDADEAVCKERTNMSEHDFKRRSARLLPPEETKQRADYVITNSGDLDHLKQQTHQVYQWMQQ